MMRGDALVLAIVLAACGNAPAPPPAPVPVHLVFGEATVTTIAETPVRELRLRPDGSVELRNERTGQTMEGTIVKDDGLVFMDGQPSFTISDHDITSLVRHAVVATIDGNTLVFPGGARVVLGSDGTIRVGDRAAWHIDASDPAVARSAFWIYATVMKP